MSEVVESIFVGKVMQKSHYNWDLLLDGQCHKLEIGKDFTCDKTTFANYCHLYARQHGKRVKTKRIGDFLYIQAFPREAAK